MPAPVISDLTSVQSHDQWQFWAFQLFATNSPILWEVTGLPAGVTIDTHPLRPLAASTAGDQVGSVAHPYIVGDRVYLPSLAGGTGFVALTIYYVVAIATDWVKLSATKDGAPITFSTDITAGGIRKVSSGLISGAASIAGFFQVQARAINADGVGALIFPVYVAPAEGSKGFYLPVEIDLITRSVTWPDSVVKFDDNLVVAVRFTNGGSAEDLDLSALRLVLLESIDKSILCESDEWEKVGAGNDAVYLVHIHITGDLAKSTAEDEEIALSDTVKVYGATVIGELSWTINNVGKIGPDALEQSGQSFLVNLQIDLETEES